MIDREKVKYSIERCISHVPDACRDCAYDAGHPYNECVEMMLNDVLSMLKEQEPVEPILDSYLKRRCPSCMALLQGKYCHECGRLVKLE